MCWCTWAARNKWGVVFESIKVDPVSVIHQARRIYKDIQQAKEPVPVNMQNYTVTHQ